MLCTTVCNSRPPPISQLLPDCWEHVVVALEEVDVLCKVLKEAGCRLDSLEEVGPGGGDLLVGLEEEGDHVHVEVLEDNDMVTEP